MTDAMRCPAISAFEFAEAYAARSGYGLREFAERVGTRREVRPCDCCDESCQGWQMAPVDADAAGWGIPLASLLVRLAR